MNPERAGWLEPAEWYASLPSFLASATAVITDPQSRVLLVKPNYREHWNLPGGVLQGDEPPNLACAREVREELGVEPVLGALLVVDWVAPTDIRRAWFGFVFDAGTVVSPDDIALQNDELDGFEFVEPAEAYSRLTRNTADRLRSALGAKATGRTVNLVNGTVVSASA
ncbi:ADP-ribose pyrophosphatase [Longispora fulva]|uniref:ADP-ribose pyrophosphatase YjhB (NUDIX family) n=1 Tax=Longispora fulva TaxID=619741 RepID=A0A8J7H307_9ACTN|nr:NUDIX hydrolase [Longispora fulva]MBG6140548.1 ADP-ribose pyrophosphatase YjhB (NUDIX family) [Longispora fulva]GIG57070.1 ADP-ribose pyrophosphatase [Longispora fulva]